jgi:lipoate-protein ligase B
VVEPVELVDLGRASYGDVLAQQRDWADQIGQGARERLVLVEHDDVITLGRGTRPENVLDRSMPVFEIERGGDATYHGPGQLVGYPLLRLKDHGLGIHSYLRGLEAMLVRTLATFGIRGQAVPRKTGVWVEGRKVASIGIAVRGGVSFHGFALNVTTDLGRFEALRPCGFDAAVMTSLQDLLGEAIPLSRVKHQVLDAFEQVFGAPVRLGNPVVNV